MIRKKPALGLDPRAATGFPQRSCSTKMPARKSLQSETISLCGAHSQLPRAKSGPAIRARFALAKDARQNGCQISAQLFGHGLQEIGLDGASGIVQDLILIYEALLEHMRVRHLRSRRDPQTQAAIAQIRRVTGLTCPTGSTDIVKHMQQSLGLLIRQFPRWIWPAGKHVQHDGNSRALCGFRTQTWNLTCTRTS